MPEAPSRRPDAALAPRHEPGARQARRARLVQALDEALARTAESESSKPSTPGARSIEPLAIADKSGRTGEWQTRQLETLNGLIAECFDLAKEEQPDLQGSFGLQFKLRADPELGGLVSELAVMEEYSTIANANMRECVSESIYALELDPPPEGVEVGSQLTLRFDPE